MKPEYLEQMQALLQQEYPAYLQALQQEPIHSFRVNTLKISPAEFARLAGVELKPVPFAADCFYDVQMDPQIRSLLTAAGLLYHQEASAASVVPLLRLQPGMRVLDLCAAPGSKSTQIGEILQQTGTLWANEIEPRRARILLENLERHGIANAIVLNENPEQLAQTFPSFFDAILCDAPCSGEGMFRRSSQAQQEWTPQTPAACARRQGHILDSAWACLKPGGILVYSTCTFNTQENEDTVRAFLKRHPDIHPDPLAERTGRPGIGADLAEACQRIYPMDGGEGQFACRLIRDGSSPQAASELLKSEPIPAEVRHETEQSLLTPYPYLYCRKGRIYGSEVPFESTGHLHLLRHHVLLGEIRRNRLEWNYAAAMNPLHPFRQQINLSAEQARHYLKGETLSLILPKGTVQVCWQKQPLGLARSDGTILKNRLPAGYRLR